MLEGETFYGEKREHVQNKATFSQTKWEVIRLMSSKPNKSKHELLLWRKKGYLLVWHHLGERGANAQKSQTPQWLASKGFKGRTGGKHLLRRWTSLIGRPWDVESEEKTSLFVS